MGSRGAALGGAMTAASDDWASGYYNPAGFAGPRNIQSGGGLTVGIDRFRGFEDVVLGYDAQDRPIRGRVRADYDDVYGLVGGAAFPLTNRLSIGATIWAPGQRLIRIMSQDPFIPAYTPHVNRSQRINLSLAAAYRVRDWLRVGAGGTALARSAFTMDVNLPAGSGADPNDSRALLALDIVPTVAPIAGVQVDAGDFAFGASYRGEQDVKVVVNERASSDVLLNLGPSLRFRTSVVIAGGFVFYDHFTPQQVALGGTWRPGAGPLTVLADATWMNWARFRGPYVDPSFEDIVVPPLGTVPVNWRQPPPTRFRDVVIPRVGGEWRFSDGLALRAGYSYDVSPAPLATGEGNILDANAHVASAGLGVRFRDPTNYVKKPVRVDLHARWRGLETTTSRKAVTYDCDDPDARPPVGYPCAGEITARGDVVSGGLDVTFDF